VTEPLRLHQDFFGAVRMEEHEVGAELMKTGLAIAVQVVPTPSAPLLACDVD